MDARFVSWINVPFLDYLGERYCFFEENSNLVYFSILQSAVREWQDYMNWNCEMNKELCDQRLY